MNKRKDDCEYTKKDVIPLRKKLLSAFVMFLVATILMTTTSYAWLVLSTAPEVSGISTNIGANGSLEMALLTTDTKADLSTIRTTVGESLAQRDPSANNTWGNLVDLSYSDYGLGSILLLPSRLNALQGEDICSVDTNLVSVPTYGFDGRIVEMNDETLSAVYDSGSNEFSYVAGNQDYGVRAIGTTDSLSVQASALALAKSNIKSYTNSAKSSTNAILGNYGDTLFNIVLTHAANSEATYGDTELDAIQAMIGSLDNVAEYIEKAMRQGIVAVAASEIGSKATFTEVRDRIMDDTTAIGDILKNLGEVGTVPEKFATWAAALSEMQNDINAAKNASEALSGGSYTWEQFRGILDYVMNVDNVLINGTPFADFDKSTATDLLSGGSVALTLAPGSGVFADIADFTGNFSSVMTFVGINIEMVTVSAVDPAYMDALQGAVNDLTPADGGEEQEAVALDETYAYAIDLAFRSNASVSELLLQTTPEHRIYDGSETGSTMGGGSYMEFSTKDNGFGLDKMIQLMDAIRVTFIDDKNEILGIAKLNTSNRSIEDSTVKASLYLYDFELSEEDGSILMGERRKTENKITDLEQNVAKAVTAIVWLDGDIVDNTMVSAASSASLNGVLNLQFASSADLIPAENTELMNITADKTALDEMLARYTAADGLITTGQSTYATTSWDSFVDAYDYAAAVSQNPNVNESQIYFAAVALATAEAQLEEISVDAVDAKIAEVRELMGTSENVARYVIKNKDGSYSAVGDEEHTQEAHDEWTVVGTVYQVDYNENLHDEGNGILTQIYTDESWVALADALYDAEAAAMNDSLTDAQLNAAFTALETAQENLQRKVFYTPYEYNGVLYYEAICSASDADTYGKWYDSDFKRVVADITILNLDAYAEPAAAFEIVQDDVSIYAGQITPYVDVLDRVYPELRDEAIKGAKWSVFDAAYFTPSTSEDVEEDEKTEDTTGTEHDCVPTISEIFAVIYENESAGVTLELTGAEGITEVSVVVISESGIVSKITKEITVYTPANGVDIDPSTVALLTGDSTTVSAALSIPEGVNFPESAEEWTWASENTSVAMVAGNNDGSCTITAVGAGETKITLSVETDQKNVHAVELTVVVTELEEPGA